MESPSAMGFEYDSTFVNKVVNKEYTRVYVLSYESCISAILIESNAIARFYVAQGTEIDVGILGAALGFPQFIGRYRFSVRSRKDPKPAQRSNSKP